MVLNQALINFYSFLLAPGFAVSHTKVEPIALIRRPELNDMLERLERFLMTAEFAVCDAQNAHHLGVARPVSQVTLAKFDQILPAFLLRILASEFIGFRLLALFLKLNRRQACRRHDQDHNDEVDD